ncbi:GreA/GreB family elongation factor [Reichenbachiella agarivorans]|uniref:GreA/GreB family elongation factor n=1 Tax=Reichenbachiella agarivorans TaxID=2979464 RepID=A0ABY6CRR0_9BACT|nr:GreA/GreB family elongation factor [Reichenbachiella agarivorans]UXP33202.1 GreA/GreB family elongation factor [Reichenbachiella agarivorans]
MTLKEDIYHACLKTLDDKIEIAKSSMEAAQESANNETKSSAGDKYETGRAMSQNERDMYAKQFTDLLHQKKVLGSIDPKKKMSTVESGALVKTEKGLFFISISIGLVRGKMNQAMAISPISPIAQQMLGKREGETFDWMKKSEQILEVL